MTNKVMIIDDNETNVKLLDLVLTKAGFKTDKIINPKFAFDIIKETKPETNSYNCSDSKCF